MPETVRLTAVIAKSGNGFLNTLKISKRAGACREVVRLNAQPIQDGKVEV